MTSVPRQSDALVHRSALALDRLYEDGAREWNDALYNLHPLGLVGRVLAQAAFAVLLAPVLAAGVVRRLRGKA